MWGPLKKLGPIGSDVLTFIGYKWKANITLFQPLSQYNIYWAVKRPFNKQKNIKEWVGCFPLENKTKL